MIERMYRPKCLTLNRKNNEMDNHNFSDPSLCVSGMWKKINNQQMNSSQLMLQRIILKRN